MDVDLVVASRCRLGEAPTWHADEQCVYWSDIAGRRLHRFHPDSGSHTTVLDKRLISGITLEVDGALLLLGRWGALYRFNAGVVESVRRIHAGQFGFRFNDAIADSVGRVIAGVMGYETEIRSLPWLRMVRRRLQRHGMISTPDGRQALVCRIEAGGQVEPIVRGLGRPNGMAFSPDGETLYVTDSRARRIYAYHYEVERGRLTDPRLFVDLTAEAGVPDGLVVDCAGCLWSARHKAGLIVRYASDGREIARIGFPTLAITSLVFGGRDFHDLYVTSGGGNDLARNGQHAGALFRIRAPLAGSPVWRSRIANA